MRKRMIDPNIWESATDKGWNSDTLVVFMSSISCADDQGKGRVSTLEKNISSMVSPRKLKKIYSSLQNSLILYNSLYYFLPNWNTYQTINKPQPSKLPDPNHPLYKGLLKNTTVPIPLPATGTVHDFDLNDYRLIEEKRKEENKIKVKDTLILNLFLNLKTESKNVNSSIVDRVYPLIDNYSLENVEAVFDIVATKDKNKRNIAYIEKILENNAKSIKVQQSTGSESQTHYRDLML